MNPDQLAPRRAQRVDVEPQLRGTAGQGRPHAPRVTARRRGDRRHRPPRQPGRSVEETDHGQVHRARRHARCRCGAATSTPTRSSRPSTSSGSPAPGSRTACSARGAANEPDFVLNQPRYAGATILVAGPDFGTGSSREHAVWALIGLRLPRRHLAALRRHLPRQLAQGRAAHRRAAGEDRAAVVGRHRGRPDDRGDRRPLDRQVRWSGEVHDFALDDYTRWRLLEGLDDIGLTLRTPMPSSVRADAQAVAAARRRSDPVATRSSRRYRPRRVVRQQCCDRPSVSNETTNVVETMSVTRPGRTRAKQGSVHRAARRASRRRQEARRRRARRGDRQRLRRVAQGEQVAITGFGVFERRDRAARTARNPATGATVDVDRIARAGVPSRRGVQGDHRRRAEVLEERAERAQAAVRKAADSGSRRAGTGRRRGAGRAGPRHDRRARRCRGGARGAG